MVKEVMYVIYIIIKKKERTIMEIKWVNGHMDVRSGKACVLLVKSIVIGGMMDSRVLKLQTFRGFRSKEIP